MNGMLRSFAHWPKWSTYIICIFSKSRLC